MERMPECGKPLDLDLGANLAINSDLVPEDLRPLIPLVNKWSFSSLTDQDYFVAQMKRHRKSELKTFNRAFTRAVDKRVREWLLELSFPKHVSEMTEEDWAHLYFAFQSVLKLRETTGEHEHDPAVDAMLSCHTEEMRLERYANTTVSADEAFRLAHYKEYVDLLAEFDDLLIESQRKKLAIAKRKLGS